MKASESKKNGSSKSPADTAPRPGSAVAWKLLSLPMPVWPRAMIRLKLPGPISRTVYVCRP